MPLMAPSMRAESLGLLDIIGPDALEHFPEQIELRIGIHACGGARPGEQFLPLGSGRQKHQAGTGHRSEEKQNFLAHCLAAFPRVVVAHYTKLPFAATRPRTRYANTNTTKI